jgi:hypothetical protein
MSDSTTNTQPTRPTTPPPRTGAQQPLRAPQQAPLQPAQGRPINDSDQQRKRRWTKNAAQIFGLTDVRGQQLILASATATCARIDETDLQPGAAAKLPQLQPGNDAAWDAFVQALRTYENLPLPRDTPQAQSLRVAANLAKRQINDPQKLGAIEEVLTSLKAFTLRDKISNKGLPPWQGNDAREAAQAKVELDLLSIPKAQRTMAVQGGGANPSFWVERSAPSGGDNKKSFLCKPASTQASMTQAIPTGGEVAREALAGQVAKSLLAKMKLDLDMPETHPITLSSDYFPGGPPPGYQQGSSILCSVQEAKPVKAPVKKTKRQDREAIHPSQCAAIAFMDLVGLNTDRHNANVFISQAGDLIPIDHGLMFPSAPTDVRSDGNAMGRDGVVRLGAALSGPHNAMLRLPGTHQPMTKDMAAGLQSLDPGQIRGELAQERDNMGQTNAVSDASLNMSLAATRFMMLAGKIKSGKKDDAKRLSPADIQVAFGANAEELIGFPPPTDKTVAKAFDKRAEEILKQALQDQAVTELTCTLEGSGFAEMRKQLKALGWTVDARVETPERGAGIAADPAVCAKLVALQIKPPTPRPSRPKQLAAARALLADVKVNQETVKDALVNIEMAALGTLAGLLSASDAATLRTSLQSQNTYLRADTKARRDLIEWAQDLIENAMRAELRQLQTQYTIPTTYSNVTLFLSELESGEFPAARIQLDTTITDATNTNHGIRRINAPQQAPQQGAQPGTTGQAAQPTQPVGTGQPQPAQTQPGQAQTGQPQPAQTQPGQAQTGQPQPAQTQPGQAQTGQPQPAQTQPGAQQWRGAQGGGRRQRTDNG